VIAEARLEKLRAAAAMELENFIVLIFEGSDVVLLTLRRWMDEMVLIEWRFEMMMLPSTRNFNVLYTIANTMPPLYNPPLPSCSSSYWCCIGQR
jgi:hypothetical protein